MILIRGCRRLSRRSLLKGLLIIGNHMAPSIWPSFFTPNYDDFEPSILQVQAQPVSADDSDQTISVTYHQYKITDRERLVEARPSFYGYDENFKFTGKVLNTTTLKVGQWYDVPPAPKGFEYCFTESVPKRLSYTKVDKNHLNL